MKSWQYWRSAATRRSLKRSDLKRKTEAYPVKYRSLQSEVSKLRTALRELTEKCRPYLEALKIAPQKVKEFIGGILEKFKKQEKSIYYEPISAREQRSKNKDYER